MNTRQTKNHSQWPQAPRVFGRNSEGHVGEQVARLRRHQEQERSGEHAQDADAAGDQNSDDPKRHDVTFMTSASRNDPADILCTRSTTRHDQGSPS